MNMITITTKPFDRTRRITKRQLLASKIHHFYMKRSPKKKNISSGEDAFMEEINV